MPKNFVLFILVCIGIFAGWFWLQQQIWPPRRPDAQQAAKKDGDKKAADKKVADKKDADKKDADKNGKDKKGDDKEGKKPPVIAEVKPPEKKPEVKDKPVVKDKPEVKPAPEPAPQTITLGNADTHLEVVLTTKGAGVQRLTLNRFKAADYLGQPMKSNLELIQDDPYVPSYLMHHYVDTEKDNHPIIGLGEKTWQLEGKKEVLADGSEEVRFSTRMPGAEHIKIIKTYRLAPKDYHLTLLLEFERDMQGGDPKAEKIRYQLAGAHGLPIEGEWYTSTFRKAIVGMLDERGTLVRSLSNEDAYVISHKAGGDRELRVKGQNMIQYAVVATQYFAAGLVVSDIQPDQQVDRRDILAWARPTLETTERVGRIKNFGQRLTLSPIKGTDIDFELLPHVKRHIEEAKLKVNDQVVLSGYEAPNGPRVATWIRRGQSPRAYLDDITVRVNSETFELAPGGKRAHQFLLYHGPVKTRLLGQFSGEAAVEEGLVDRYTDKLHLRTLTDYQSPGPFGTFAKTIRFTDLLIACTKLMHLLLYALSFLVFGSHGLSIILLTVLVRGLMFPISRKQALFSIKMQELAPKMKEIAEKYKNDPQGKIEATRDLHRKHDINMLSGCLPMFLQLPIFLGLYYALQESISFRLASFLWIDNLAAPDMLVWWGESIPWVSDPDSQGGFFYLGPYFNLLPMFAVGLMFMQQKLMTPPPTDEQQAIQQKTFQFMMVFMGIVFYKVASGLCIYFIASSLWGLAERKLLPKKKPPGEAVPAASFSGSKSAPARGKGKDADKSNGNGKMQGLKDWWADILEKARKK